MAKFTYDDIVKIVDGVAPELRPGSKAWVVGVFEEKDRQGQYFELFPEGVVYTVEFEDGKSTEIHEADIVLCEE